MIAACPAPPRRPIRSPRARSERARSAVLEAAEALLHEGGYPAVTIEAVAERSGVARTTIYRWWPNRAALAIDVLLHLAAVVAPPPTGTEPLRAIRLELRRIAAAASEPAGRLLLALLGEAQHDPAVRAALLERVIHPRRDASARAIREAQVRGELCDDVHPHVAVDLIYGPVFYRLLMGHAPATERFAMQALERVLDGLAPDRQARARGPGTARRRVTG